MSISVVKPVSTNIVSNQPKMSFTSNPQEQNNKNNINSGMLLATLALLGAAGIYIATRGKAGKEAAEKAGTRAAEQAAESTKPIAEAEKAVVEKLRINKREVISVKPIVLNKPDGTNIQATAITEKLNVGNGRIKKVETVYDSDGEILRKRIVPMKSGIDYTVKKVVEENGQKVTKKYKYKNGKINSTDICTFNPQTKVVKIVTKNPENVVLSTVQKTEDKYGPRLMADAHGDYELRYITPDGLNDSIDANEIQRIIKEQNLPFEI